MNLHRSLSMRKLRVKRSPTQQDKALRSYSIMKSNRAYMGALAKWKEYERTAQQSQDQPELAHMVDADDALSLIDPHHREHKMEDL